MSWAQSCMLIQVADLSNMGNHFHFKNSVASRSNEGELIRLQLLRLITSQFRKMAHSYESRSYLRGWRGSTCTGHCQSDRAAGGDEATAPSNGCPRELGRDGSHSDPRSKLLCWSRPYRVCWVCFRLLGVAAWVSQPGRVGPTRQTLLFLNWELI